jgi:cation diffusion facilitator CzcD-associated flavoprotein CzcO
MGFLDFPFVPDDGAGTESSYSGDPRRFPGHAEVLQYLEAFARRFDLHGLVRFETEVVRVRRDDAGAGWKVSYCSRKLAHGSSEQLEVFDAVVVCNGHLAEPHIADIAGNHPMSYSPTPNHRLVTRMQLSKLAWLLMAELN